MTAFEYLSRPAALRREIARKQEHVETLRRLATRFVAPLKQVTVRSSPDPSRMETFLADAADGEQEIRLLEEDLRRVEAETAVYISALPDVRLILLLEMRYLDGLSWAEVIRRMGYSHASVFRFHQQALDLLPPPPEDPEEDVFPRPCKY